MAQSNEDCKKTAASNKRKAEEEQTARLLRKRTLYLGEVDSSSSEDELDRLFPGWWENDQHLAECDCDFCKLYHTKRPGKASVTKATSSLSLNTGSNGSDGVAVEQHQNPKTPDAA